MFPAFNTAIVPTLMAETEKFFDAVAFVQEGDVPGPVPQPGGVREHARRRRSTACRASGFTTDFKETTLDANQRPGFLTRVGLPERLRVLQPHVADSPRRLHHEAGAGHADRHAAAGRGGDGAAARLGRSQHQPQAGRRADDRRRLRDRATTATSTRPASRWRRSTPSAPGRRRRSRPARPSTRPRTSSSTADRSTSPAPFDLMTKIAASPMAQHRYAERLTSFLYEREGDPIDCGTVNDLATKIAPGGYTAPEPHHGSHPDSSVPNPSRRSDVMNRRVFLRGVGGVSLAAPFLPSVSEQDGQGAGDDARPSAWSSSSRTTVA